MIGESRQPQNKLFYDPFQPFEHGLLGHKLQSRAQAEKTGRCCVVAFFNRMKNRAQVDRKRKQSAELSGESSNYSCLK